jgi:hypothetical protein
MFPDRVEVGVDIGVAEERWAIEALEELLEEIHGPIQVRIAKREATGGIVNDP